MLRANGKTTVSQRHQYLSNRMLMQTDAKAPLDLIAQVDASPANDFMTRGVGAGLDQRRHLRALRWGQLSPATAAMTVAQPRQTFSIVAMHPIAQCLTVHPAESRRARAIMPFKNERKRQDPPRRRPVLLARRCLTMTCRRQILSRNRYRLAHRRGS
jgi:hypothetical protein